MFVVWHALVCSPPRSQVLPASETSREFRLTRNKVIKPLSSSPKSRTGSIYLDSQWENFKLFGLIYYAYPKKFELFWAWLLKKRV